MTLMAIIAGLALSLLAAVILAILTTPKRRDEAEAVEAMPRETGCPEVPDSALGFQDGYEWAKAGHLSYICEGDYWGRDRDYWHGFHQGYRAYRRTEEQKP